MMENKTVTANSFELVDEKGNIRAIFSALTNGVSLTFSDASGKTQLKMAADNAGLSSLSMYDTEGKEKVGISLDDQGTHVHLGGTDKQESYLFLKNSGASGLVMTDKNGERRLEAKVGPDGQPDVKIFTLNGETKEL